MTAPIRILFIFLAIVGFLSPIVQRRAPGVRLLVGVSTVSRHSNHTAECPSSGEASVRVHPTGRHLWRTLRPGYPLPDPCPHSPEDWAKAPNTGDGKPNS